MYYGNQVLIGFGLAALLLILLKAVVRQPHLYEPPKGDRPPPAWIRGILILTCTGVSFAHGSNDGQKGIGMIMLILIGLLPAHYALNMEYDRARIDQTVQQVSQVEDLIGRRVERGFRDAGRIEGSAEGGAAGGERGVTMRTKVHLAGDTIAASQKQALADLPDSLRRSMRALDIAALQKELAEVRTLLTGSAGLSVIQKEQRWQLRTDLLEADAALEELEHRVAVLLTDEDRAMIKHSLALMRGATDYAPTWVLLMVALSLGIGTTIGWKRIVVTVGEKIGKTHLTYAQGASAELVAMTTIGMADILGMPVSTTHVLSSAVAGTMVANRSGLQLRTVTEIALAWILTLPVAMLLSGGLFALFSRFVG